MSIPVPADRLRAAIDERDGTAYLLTVSDDTHPHAVHVAVSWDGDALVVADVGSRSAANAAARPAVTLVFAVRAEADYTLIVDGSAVVESIKEGRRLRIEPTKAVLHRRAAAPNPASPCSADCVPILPR
ncbi:MAG TPA: pyridoxamine 5'-phosphate oxidase family protein [Candidatus Binatia bacterium]|nr:pyridoxamine 5'-phosphate oxidase family protein [Candidatus Binatia bacterium]